MPISHMAGCAGVCATLVPSGVCDQPKSGLTGMPASQANWGVTNASMVCTLDTSAALAPQ